MTTMQREKPATIWLGLAALTTVSVLLAERAYWGHLAIPVIFGIAALRGELVLRRFMEVGQASPHGV